MWLQVYQAFCPALPEGFDKHGRPIYWERTGVIRLPKVRGKKEHPGVRQKRHCCFAHRSFEFFLTRSLCWCASVCVCVCACVCLCVCLSLSLCLCVPLCVCVCVWRACLCSCGQVLKLLTEEKLLRRHVRQQENAVRRLKVQAQPSHLLCLSVDCSHSFESNKYTRAHTHTHSCDF